VTGEQLRKDPLPVVEGQDILNPLFEIWPEFLLGQEPGRSAGKAQDADILVSGIGIPLAGKLGPGGILDATGYDIHLMSQLPESKGHLLYIDQLSPKIGVLCPSVVAGIKVTLRIQESNMHNQQKLLKNR
jgi:hypothetical protein